MKAFIGFIMALASLNVFAGNKYEMTKNGHYVGRLSDGRECSIEVSNIRKKLLTRTVTSMDVTIKVPGLVKSLSLGCEFNFENGHGCITRTSDFSIWIDTKAGYHADTAPNFMFSINNGEYKFCSDLVLN